MNPENEKTVQLIEEYLKYSRLPVEDRKNIIEDIKNMLLSGQLEGRETSEIIGGDYKVFVDNIIASSYQMTNLEMIFKMLSEFGFMMVGILIVLILYSAFTRKPQVEIDLVFILIFGIYMLIETLIKLFFVRKSLDTKNQYKWLSFLIPGIIYVTIFSQVRTEELKRIVLLGYIPTIVLSIVIGIVSAIISVTLQSAPESDYSDSE